MEAVLRNLFKSDVELAPRTTAGTQKQYPSLLGGVTNMDESTLSNDEQTGEVGQSTAWHCAEQMV
jgi:hypothetical protein